MGAGAEGVGELLGAGRFRLIRQLGRGGMGAVYEAEDLQRRERVALKVLLEPSLDAIARFKQEFRALTDISHPNLVALFELLSDGARWFFTMELVDGVNLVEFLCGERIVDHDAETEVSDDSFPITATQSLGTDDAVDVTAAREAQLSGSAPRDTSSVPHFRHRPAKDWPKIRRTFAQLTEGVAFLHERGKLHRDLKPSNVLVTPEGRVVILDFGILTALGAETDFAGTPAYMAPEQIHGGAALSGASDLYSMGTILYQVLTGRRPFESSPAEVLAQKQWQTPEPCAALIADIPEELSELCDALLSSNPDERPSIGETLTTLSESETSGPRLSTKTQLVGREPELSLLRQALRSSASGIGRAVLVSGRSGIGKSVLIDEFLTTASEEHSAVVLRGRCYEREHIPYKSIDSLVEGLVALLEDLNEAEVAGLLSERDAVLVNVFPAFGPIFAELRLGSAGLRFDGEFGEQRRLAFASLARVLRALSQRSPLVIAIDDFQWGDLDSLPFVESLVADDELGALVILSFREEERSRSTVLRKLLADLDEDSPRIEMLRVEELSSEALEELVRHALPQRDLAPTVAKRIAKEARGSAYFATELLRFIDLEGDPADLAGLTLDDVLHHRVEGLPKSARQMLETICVAGAPLTQSAIRRAAAVTQAARPMLQLRAGQLVTTSGPAESDSVEAFHNQVRMSVLAAMSEADIRARHAAIATTLDSETATDDRDRLYLVADHYAHAGELVSAQRTFELCLQAARAAMAAQAFATADEHLSRAAAAAERGSLSVDAAFYELRADIGVRRGRATDVEEYASSALELATDSSQRARLYLMLAQLHLGVSATRSAYEYGTRALHALGLREPRRGLWPMIGALARFALSRLQKNQRPVISPEERARLLLTSQVVGSLGMTMYFELERARPVRISFEQYAILHRLGDTPEMVSLSCLAGAMAAVLKRRDLSERMLTGAREMAERMRDPETAALARIYHGLALNFLGDPVAAEKELDQCFEERGDYLRIYDYTIATGGLVWNQMMRGQTERAWAALERTYRRARADSQSEMSSSWIHHLYAGTVLAMMGRSEESDARFSTFRSGRLGPGTSASMWAKGQYWAHRVMQLVELDRLHSELDHALGELAQVFRGPRRMPEQMRHCLVAECYARLRLARQEPGKPSQTRLRTALRRLKKADTHPTLRAHRLIIESGEALLHDRSARSRKLLEQARSLAHDTDNVWVELEVLLTSYRLGDGEDKLEQALELASRQGWEGRKRRIEEELLKD